MHGLFACLGPEVKMVARSTALEALECVASEVRREGALFPCLCRAMEGTDTTYLVASPTHDDKPQEFQHFGHRYVGSKLPKVYPRHGGPQRHREEEPVILRNTA